LDFYSTQKKKLYKGIYNDFSCILCIQSWCLIRNRNCLLFMSTWFDPRFIGWVCVAHLFSFQCCVSCFVCLRSVSFAQFFLFLMIVQSWLPHQFSLMFICYLRSSCSFSRQVLCLKPWYTVTTIMDFRSTHTKKTRH
jgi:hypothetical protein